MIIAPPDDVVLLLCSLRPTKKKTAAVPLMADSYKKAVGGRLKIGGVEVKK